MIRKAIKTDIPRILDLLLQVCNVHHDGRADLFRRDGRKYNKEELEGILADPDTPVFAYTDENDVLIAYCFCILQRHEGQGAMTDHTTLYIDDLCVDEAHRGKKIGQALYNHAKSFAKENGCYNITLNVWSKNESALAFYRRIGMQVQKYGMEEVL